MAWRGCAIKPKDAARPESVEDHPKMMMLAIVTMLGDRLDQFKQAERNQNAELATAVVCGFFDDAAKLWPHKYGTLQQLAKYVADDLGFVIEDMAIAHEVGNA